MHSSYQQRSQQANYTRNPASGAMSSRAGVNSVGMPSNSGNNTVASMAARQTAQSHQQQTTQQTVPSHMVYHHQHQPLLLPFNPYPNQRIPTGFVPAGNSHFQYINMPPFYSLLPQQQNRSNAGSAQAIQAGTPIGASVGATPVGGANSQQQQQQPAQHQTQINQHTQHYLQQPAANPTAMNAGTGIVLYPVAKQAKKILEIIDPKTGQNVMDEFKSNKPSLTGSSNSAPLLIEPPPAATPTSLNAKSWINPDNDSNPSTVKPDPSAVFIADIAITTDTAETAKSPPGMVLVASSSERAEPSGGRYRWQFGTDGPDQVAAFSNPGLVEIPISENVSGYRKTGTTRTGAEKFVPGARKFPPGADQMPTTAHETYKLEQREQLNDVHLQPHTPVVSAIAYGPSVDIPPKQSKYVKRR